MAGKSTRTLPSAAELVAMFARREMSPVEATSEALAVIEELDGRVGAFRSVFAERASEEAESRTALLSKNEILGPLHGVPVAIKELFDVEGATTSYASRAVPARTAARDAVAVARLRAGTAREA
jgi:Asp-tRNA(Asn)/Glu-tRNA(Gln) amidotransferase A subunit family amidase